MERENLAFTNESIWGKSRREFPKGINGSLFETFLEPEYPRIQRIEKAPGIKEFMPRNALLALSNFLKIPDDYEGNRTVIFNGPPVSGKTHTRTVAELAIDRFYNDTINTRMRTITWEAQGELAGREKESTDDKKITSLPSEPLSQSEIQTANRLLEIASLENITGQDRKKENSKVQGKKRDLITLYELPATSAYKKSDGTFFGRPLGTPLLYKLSTSAEDFNINSENRELRYVSLVGGALLHEIMPYFRNGMKTTTSLDEAQHIAQIFGKSPPKTTAEFIRMRTDGATFNQIELIESVMDTMFEEMEKDGLLPKINQEEVEDFYDKYVKEATEILGLNPNKMRRRSHRSLREINYHKYLLFEVFKTPSENTFIGFNNPSINDMRIQEIDAVKKEIQRQNGIMASQKAYNIAEYL